MPYDAGGASVSTDAGSIETPGLQSPPLRIPPCGSRSFSLSFYGEGGCRRG